MLERKVELTVKVNAYSEDFKILLKKAYAAGISFEELLELFIGDLAGGKAASGSDESRLADEWYRRHVFPRAENMTFVQYLLERGHVDPCIVGELILNIDLCKLAYWCEKGDNEEDTDIYIDCILEDVREILNLYAEYRASCKDCEELHQALEGACKFAVAARKMRRPACEVIEFMQEFWDWFDGYVRKIRETEGDV